MINDTINPMGLDLSKNLHGHVRVELRDRWTGRVVDSQEKDNLVTNAVRDMLLTTAWTSAGMAGSWTPLYAKALGGVFLFDGTLTESADNISFPASPKLIAYAGQGGNTSEAIGGSYNGSESVKTSNGFTTVWDFATSQANGTIAALARTSYAFTRSPAYNPNNNFDYAVGSGVSFSYVYYLGYDSTNHYLYIATGTGSAVAGGNPSVSAIYRVKQDFSKIRLNNQAPPFTEWELFKTLSSSDGSNQARYWTYDAYANNLVYAYNAATIHIIAADGTHSTKTATGTSSTYALAITENYYWRTSGNGTIWRIEKANPANIQSIALTATALFPMENDVICAGNSSNGTETNIVYPDGTIITKVNTGAAIAWTMLRRSGPFYSAAQLAGTGASNANFLWPNSHYLGTIANLDNPVTKSSSQTMKITYTLTEA